MLVSFKAALVVATAAFSHAIAFDEVGVASIDGDAAEGHVRGFKVSSIATYDLTATSVGPDNADTYGGDDEYTDVEIGNGEIGFDVEVDEDAQVTVNENFDDIGTKFLRDVAVGVGGCQSSIGGGCSVFKKCCPGKSCQPGMQKCYHSPRKLEEPCVAGFNCGSGLSCHPAVQKCYNSPRELGQPCSSGYGCKSGIYCRSGVQKCENYRKVGETCDAGKLCGSGLNCHPGVHKCYNVPRELNQPCSSGYGCKSGIYCRSGVQKCENYRTYGQSCNAGLLCGGGLSCQPGVHKCYHVPRRLLEPCSAGYECEADYNCQPGTQICVVPCTKMAKSETLKAKLDIIEAKEIELEEAKNALEGALNYYTAKLRGETVFLEEDLQAYEQPDTFCVASVDTSSAVQELCNDEDSNDVVDDVCTAAPADDQGQVCNVNATSGEVLVRDELIRIKSLEDEIAELVIEADELLEQYRQDAEDSRPDCMQSVEDFKNFVDDMKAAANAVAQFVDNAKCIIIPILLKLVAMVVDKIAGKLPYIGPAISALQSQPQCLGPVDWKHFSLQVPGGLVTGKLFFAAVQFLLCLIGDIDEGLYFFKDVCIVVDIVGNLVNSLISGLCGKFAAAFLSIAEPFIVCNMWDCGEDYNIPCICPFKFDQCTADDFPFGGMLELPSAVGEMLELPSVVGEVQQQW